MSLFSELRRRNVFRVGIAYVIVAWLLLQVADTLGPALRLPEWFQSGVVFVLILGFPLILIFAWAFELTPEGLKRERDVDRSQSITPQTGQRLNFAIIALLGLAVIYLGLDKFVFEHEHEEGVTRSEQSIAVLPFENMSSDEEQEYFSDGLTEELLNLLAKIPELKVTSRTSAFFYKGKDIRLSDVGRQLNVDHILEGSVRRSGAKVRITAQLIEVATDTHLWSETWDRDLDDVFVIQDEIAAKVVDELRVQLLGELPHAVTTDGETYSLFLQARHTISQRTHESLLRGEELIDKALEIDPDYAPGWVLKAYILSQQGDVGARLPTEVAPLARAAVNRALELDPNDAAAHALSGDIMIAYERNFEDAKAAFDRALELDPVNVDVLYHASMYFVFIGQPERALPLSLAARERDPLFTANQGALGYIYSVLGQFEAAEEVLTERIAIAPDAFGNYYYLAGPLLFMGRHEEALKSAQQELLDGFRYTSLAIVHWYMGNREASDEALANLISTHEGGWDYQIVQAHAVRGELDEAFEAMEAAYDNRDSGLQLILGDRYLENLRDDPRYEAMVQKMGIRPN